MRSAHLLLILLPLLLAAKDSQPAAMKVGSDCKKHAADYTLVRTDVLAQLDADSQNLELAEDKLAKAQKDLQEAERTLVKVKKDLVASQDAFIKQRGSNAELRAQVNVLQGHITKLEAQTCPEPSIADQLVYGWEQVDGVAGIAAGYTLGMGTCIGVAYVFNQPAFVR